MLFLKFSNPERLRLLHLHFFHEFHDRGIWCNGKRRFLDCIIRSVHHDSRTHESARVHGGRVLEVDLGHGLRKLHGRVKEASQRLDRQGKDFGHGFRKVNKCHGTMGCFTDYFRSQKKDGRFFTKSEKRVNAKCQVFRRTKSCGKGGILA